MNLYKPSRTHVVANALFRFLNTIIPDQTIDVALFMLQPIWLEKVKSCLQMGQMPRILTNTHKQWLTRITEPFTLQKGIIYCMGQDNKQYVTTIEVQTILWELHEGFGGSHFASNITAKKIFDARYWWPKLFHDAFEFFKSCDACQKVGGLTTQSLAKLIIILPKEPFMKFCCAS